MSANRYWVGGTGNWAEAVNHWASSSGGSPDVLNAPTSGDDVIFDANSGTGTVAINSPIVVNTITFSAACSVITVDISAGATDVLSASGGIVMNSSSNGTLRVSGGNLTVTDAVQVNGGVLQLNSGSMTINGVASTGAVGLGINGGTVNCAGATLTVGDGTNEVIDLESGTFEISAGTVNLQTEFFSNGGTFNMSGGTLNLNNSAASERSYSMDLLGASYNFTGGVIDLKNVSGNNAFAIWIDKSTTPTGVSGGTLRLSATNANYYIHAEESDLYNLEIAASAKTVTVHGSDLLLNGNLTLSSGTLDAGLYDVYIKGNWVNNSGTFNYGTRNVIFNGSSAQQILGSAASTFYNLTLDNTNGLTVAPGTGIATSVRNTFTLSNGKISLGDHDLNIGATAVSGIISGAGSSKYIVTNGTGVLKQYNIGTGQRTSVDYPIGISSASYTPVTLTVVNTTTVDNFSAKASQSVLVDGTSGAAYSADVVDRTWNIAEGTTGGSNVTLTVQWNAGDELTSFDRTVCYVSHYTGGAWGATSTDAAAAGSGPYTRVSGTLTSFSPFGVGSHTVLPINLLNFIASPDQDKVDLNWSTTMETNNDYFTVERSVNGNSFEVLTIVEGAGNSNSLLNYTTSDRQPLNGTSYYRLKQTDFDGKHSYSKIIAVTLGKQSRMQVFPNPSESIVNLSFSAKKAGEQNVISICDVNGELVYSQNYTSIDGVNKIPLDLTYLSVGMYFVTVSNAQQTTMCKIIRK